MDRVSQIRFWITVAHKADVSRWLRRALSDVNWPQRVTWVQRVDSCYIVAFQSAVEHTIRRQDIQPWEMASRLSRIVTPLARDDVLYLGMPNQLVDRTAIYSTVAEVLCDYFDWLKNADPGAHAEFMAQISRVRPWLQRASRILILSRFHKGGDLGTLSELPFNIRDSICSQL